mmetsp:Transcript_883/g.2419  ORF Transcript_883/g.2419 Transcript_883/m.2419 type:complete len:208 (+) Transcript_883:96-719(+)
MQAVVVRHALVGVLQVEEKRCQLCHAHAAQSTSTLTSLKTSQANNHQRVFRVPGELKHVEAPFMESLRKVLKQRLFCQKPFALSGGFTPASAQLWQVTHCWHRRGALRSGNFCADILQNGSVQVLWKHRLPLQISNTHQNGQLIGLGFPSPHRPQPPCSICCEHELCHGNATPEPGHHCTGLRTSIPDSPEKRQHENAKSTQASWLH